MKIRLTPELSYFIGLWGYARSAKGIGVRGSDDLVEAFAKTCLDMKLTGPGKMLYAENEIFFYNSALQKFMNLVWSERTERFKYGNDYSAAYIAGIFDATGSLEGRRLCMRRIDVIDLTLLSNLKLLPEERRGRVFIGREKAFLKFISPYIKLNRDLLALAGIA
jgi:hypothetical protein